MKKTPLLFLLTLLLTSVFAISSTGISIKFNNNTDEDIFIHTAQYGGEPKLHQQTDLTKDIEIKKQSSKQIFLFETASWLIWQAKSEQGDIIQKGTLSLNQASMKRLDIDINPPEKKK